MVLEFLLIENKTGFEVAKGKKGFKIKLIKELCFKVIFAGSFFLLLFRIR